MAEVYVSPNGVWEYAMEMLSRYDGRFIDVDTIAADWDNGIFVNLGCDGTSEFRISVDFEEGTRASVEYFDNEIDAEYVCTQVFEEYLLDYSEETEDDLSSVVFEDEYEEYDEKMIYEIRQDDIEVREDELDCLVIEFITGVVNEVRSSDIKGFSDIVADCKERFVEYLAKNYGLKVYRPMYLEDEDGVFFAEYPYECME